MKVIKVMRFRGKTIFSSTRKFYLMDRRLLPIVGPLQDEIKEMAQSFEDRSDDIVNAIDTALMEKGINLSLSELESIAESLLTGRL